MTETWVGFRAPVLCFEGVPTSDGRVIGPGTLTCGQLPLPVYEPGGDHPLGSLDSVERDEETGTWRGVGRVPGDVAAGMRGRFPGLDIRGADMRASDDGRQMTLTGGVIIAMAVTPNPAWPDMPELEIDT